MIGVTILTLLSFAAIGDPEGGYDYTRGGNPTRSSLQTCLGKLENAKHAFVYASGMAATSTVATALLRSGSRILAMNDLYGGTNRFVELHLLFFPSIN